MPLSTVSGILTRIGLGKLWRLDPLEPPNRYEKKPSLRKVAVWPSFFGDVSAPPTQRGNVSRNRQNATGKPDSQALLLYPLGQA
jgi:hypothetical protein